MIDSRVLAVIDEVEAFQRTRDDAWNVPRDEGMLLHTLARLGGCRTVVEVGTSYGFSGLFLAAAARANGGLLHTFDINPMKHEHAARHFAKAGLSDAVRLHTGDALAELPRLPGRVDFAFLDAAKPQTFDYWRAIEDKLSPRCVVAVDNTGSHREQLADFVAMLRGRADFTSCDVPVGNGFELAVRS